MTPRQAGWRTARSAPAAPPPVRHDVALPQPVAAPQPSQPPRLRPASPYPPGSISELLKNGNWSLSFIGILGYVYAAVTYGLPIVGPSIVIALLGLVFERTRIVLPLFLVIFALYVAWGAFGISSSIQPEQSGDQVVVLVKVLLIAFVLVNVTREAWRIRMFTIFFLACFALYPA